MNQTNGDSKNDSNSVEVVVDIFAHNPELQRGKYEIITGKDISGIENITEIGPGVIIPVKDGIEASQEVKKQILEKQKNRKTKKQVKNQSQR